MIQQLLAKMGYQHLQRPEGINRYQQADYFVAFCRHIHVTAVLILIVQRYESPLPSTVTAPCQQIVSLSMLERRSYG
jgi:hypothetical protein